MFGGKQQQGMLSQVARALQCGGQAGGDTLSPNSARSMINAFRKPLGLPLYLPKNDDSDGEKQEHDPSQTGSLITTKIVSVHDVKSLTFDGEEQEHDPSGTLTKSSSFIPHAKPFVRGEQEHNSSNTGPLITTRVIPDIKPFDGRHVKSEGGEQEHDPSRTLTKTSSFIPHAKPFVRGEQEHNPSKTGTLITTRVIPDIKSFDGREQEHDPSGTLSRSTSFISHAKPFVRGEQEHNPSNTGPLTIPTRAISTPLVKPFASEEHDPSKTRTLTNCALSTPDVRPFAGLPPSAPGSRVKSKRTTTKPHHQANCWKLTTEKVCGTSYLILKQLGKGGSGEVYLVMENETRELYALKKVNMQLLDASGVQECVNEVTMLLELKDTELVIQIIDWEIDQRIMKIVMEYGQCDLSKTIVSRSSTLIKIKSCWESMLQIVQTIHSKGIVHGDLKPANFVWVAGRLKIIDFGIANKIQVDVTSIQTYNPKGTLNFMSPESILPDAFGRSKISPKADIWSLGCILYLMIYGYAPFQNYSNQNSKMNAIIGGMIEYPSFPAHLADLRILDVLKLCFQLDSRNRPDATTLLRHSLLTS